MLLPLRASEGDRLRAIALLKRGYVTGRLSTETFEARLVVAQTATSRASLRALLADVSARWFAAETLLGLRQQEPAPLVAPWAVLLLSRCDRQELVVGRSRRCDVVLRGACVSRRHAIVSRIDGAWTVTDLDSMNGTFVDEVRVERAPIEPGRRIRLGDAYLDIA